jgi:prolyl-tRNA editing enzyme YbaK/EbsC (Cys-tRNA(Pro) deacylase)
VSQEPAFPIGEDGDRARLDAALAGLGVAYELFPCDPALADTAAFCAAYGFDPDESANTIIVAGKADPRRYAACIVLAPHRLDVNRVVCARLQTRKASFAAADETRTLTGMEIGGVTPFGLPPGLPIWVDAAVMTRARRRQPQLEGHRAAHDPAGAPQRRGRRGSRPRSAGDLSGAQAPALILPRIALDRPRAIPRRRARLPRSAPPARLPPAGRGARR